jgi:hypothetical protein
VSDTSSSGAPEGPGDRRDEEGSAFSWSALVDDWVSYGNDLAERLSAKASERAEGIRARSYSADDWVADVDWFWEQVHDDAVRAARYWRDRLAPK